MKHTSLARSASLALALIALTGCEDKAPSQPVTPEAPATALGKTVKMAKDVKGSIEAQDAQAGAAAAAISGQKGNVVIGPLSFNVTDPFERVEPKPSPFAPKAEFKAGDASLKFSDAGGDVASNLQRWKGQMSSNVTAKEMTVGTTKVWVLKMEGTYIGMGPTGGAAPSMPGTKFFGAIIEPQGGGQIQVKLIGPRDSVEAVEKQWDTMIAAVQAK